MSDEGSLYYLRDCLRSEDKAPELVGVLREGRRLGFLDTKFLDEPEMFTEKEAPCLFDIPIEKLKVRVRPFFAGVQTKLVKLNFVTLLILWS